MILVGAAALLLLAFGAAEQGPRGTRGVVVRQHIILRIPNVAPHTARRGPLLIRWREGRGMRCVPVSSLAGATSLGQNSVDLILRDNSRVRARLEQRCPALDYYRGFYIDTTADGRICAGRDVIRSRAGGECQIDQFRTLSPEARR